MQASAKSPMTKDLQRLLQSVVDVETVLRRGAVLQSAITLINNLSAELKRLSKVGVGPVDLVNLAKQLDSAAGALSAATGAPTGPGYTSPIASPGGARPRG
jgi:hypothetical protein